jgi:hypothetical protein
MKRSPSNWSCVRSIRRDYFRTCKGNGVVERILVTSLFLFGAHFIKMPAAELINKKPILLGLTVLT